VSAQRASVDRQALVWLAALVAAATVLAEVLLHPPTTGERIHLLVILAGPAVVAAALVPLLRRWVSRRASVAGAALTAGLSALVVGGVSTSAASNAMFVSAHDFRLFLVVLLLSCGIALLVGVQLTRPLAGDIARLGEVAGKVAGGDLSARTGITRHDEVGTAARAVDSMVAALADADEERERATTARRQMFASIGHDLRTPLAAMRAAVESLQDGVAPDPQRYLAILGTQVAEIEALLDQFVEFARIESGTPSGKAEPVSVSELADEAVEALSPVAHRHGVVLRAATDDAAVVRARSTEIARVIRNLLDNAIRHSPQGGTVSISVVNGDGVALTVSDEGPGFPDDFRGRAFEPFARADPARNARTGHAGLGLAISRALVEAHGGRIWIGDGPGARIHLWLPKEVSS
jgi:two-component system sensor histidine kinase BaeS